MSHPKPAKRFKCRVCGCILPAWIRVPGEVDGAMLLGHVRQHHPDRVKTYLDQMLATEDIDRVVQAYEILEDDGTAP